MRRIMTSLALGLLLIAGGPGPAAAQSPQAETLALQVAQSMFDALSLDDLIARGAAKETADAFAEVKSRPEWRDFLVQALQEEMRNDMPAIERMFARGLARQMTAPELEAGAALLADPTMQAALAAASSGGPEPDRLSPAAERILSTASGRGFLAKMEKIDEVLDPMLDEFLIELLPGTLRRFGEKAEAGEARRRASRP